jgi:hypothetical protein
MDGRSKSDSPAFRPYTTLFVILSRVVVTGQVFNGFRIR